MKHVYDMCILLYNLDECLCVLPQSTLGPNIVRNISVPVKSVCVYVHIYGSVYSMCPCVYVWATAASPFLLRLQSQEVMKINERNGGGRLRSRYSLPVSGQSSIDPPVLHSAGI